MKNENKAMMDITVVQTAEPITLIGMPFLDRMTLYSEIEAKSFYMRGKILLSVQEDNCYKEQGFKTFEEAIKNILSISRGYAYELMSSVTTFDNLCGNTTQKLLPKTSSQLSELRELTPEQQVKVWDAVADGKDKVPTTKEVRLAKEKLFPKDNKDIEEDKPKEEKTTVPVCLYGTTGFGGDRPCAASLDKYSEIAAHSIEASAALSTSRISFVGTPYTCTMEELKELMKVPDENINIGDFTTSASKDWKPPVTPPITFIGTEGMSSKAIDISSKASMERISELQKLREENKEFKEEINRLKKSLEEICDVAVQSENNMQEQINELQKELSSLCGEKIIVSHAIQRAEFIKSNEKEQAKRLQKIRAQAGF